MKINTQNSLGEKRGIERTCSLSGRGKNSAVYTPQYRLQYRKGCWEHLIVVSHKTSQEPCWGDRPDLLGLVLKGEGSVKIAYIKSTPC